MNLPNPSLMQGPLKKPSLKGPPHGYGGKVFLGNKGFLNPPVRPSAGTGCRSVSRLPGLTGAQNFQDGGSPSGTKKAIMPPFTRSPFYRPFCPLVAAASTLHTVRVQGVGNLKKIVVLVTLNVLGLSFLREEIMGLAVVHGFNPPPPRVVPDPRAR